MNLTNCQSNYFAQFYPLCECIHLVNRDNPTVRPNRYQENPCPGRRDRWQSVARVLFDKTHHTLPCVDVGPFSSVGSSWASLKLQFYFFLNFITYLNRYLTFRGVYFQGNTININLRFDDIVYMYCIICIKINP